MKSKLIHEQAGQRTFVLVFDRGDEASGGLRDFAREHGLGAAHFSGIGAFSDVRLGYFDLDAKEYRPIDVDEQVEVVSLLGDVALQDGEPAVHAHVVVAGPDGSTRGGHLLRAHVRPTLEVVLTESPARLRKRHDPETGLALIALDGGSAEPGPAGEASLPHVPDESPTPAADTARRAVADEGAPRGATEEGAGLEP